MNQYLRLTCWLHLIAAGLPGSLSGAENEVVHPLLAAHAHNDYHHPRPLLDALDRGFCSVEADVFLVNGQLLVGHEEAELRSENTLQRLYLDPLRERVQANGGHVHGDRARFTLLIDIKSEGPATYSVLRDALASYRDLISSHDEQGDQVRAVQVVVSGNCPRQEIAADPLRLARIDGRLTDLDSGESAELMPLISDRWTAHFGWLGQGDFSAEEREKLHSVVRHAHAAGRRVRFWATPEEPLLWRELLAAGVDHISTDQLDRLRDFLLHQPTGKIVLWNGARLFDQASVAKRADDLSEFGRYFHDADIIVLDEVTSLEVVHAARDRMGFSGYYTACSDFAQEDWDTYNSLEVGLLSRFPVENVLEYDQTPDNTGATGEPAEEQLVKAEVPGLVEVSVPRGFLSVDVPALHLTIVATHLKSSRGLTGEPDRENAEMREYVAAAMATHVADKLAKDPGATVLVAGDLNVGETDRKKNGRLLLEDRFNAAEGDLYDDTHAIFSAALINGLRMSSLTRGLGAETFDDARFAGAGPIDCLYVAGPLGDRFAAAQRSSRNFGSDHFAVSTRIQRLGVAPDPAPAKVPRVASDEEVRISALLPNPRGPDGGQEWVKLKNASGQTVQLAGWRIRDRARNEYLLSGALSAYEERTIQLPEGQLPLNNGGDEIELVDPDGRCLQAVRYTGDQATAGSEVHVDRS